MADARNENYVPSLLVIRNDEISEETTMLATGRVLTNAQPVDVAMVDSDGNQIVSFGGGKEYDEGTTDATITGKAIMWEDAGDTLRVVSAAKPLPVEPKGTAINSYTQVSVSNTATKIVSTNANRRGVEIANHGSTDIFLGNDASITTSNAYKLGGNESITLWTDEEVYGIVSSGSETVGILEYA